MSKIIKLSTRRGKKNLVQNTKVINLFGAPGSGKSTLSAGLFYQMKMKKLKVEQAQEWIKDKVFEETAYPFKDQLYTFAKQNKKIRQMVGKADYIICDSPLIQGLLYVENEPDIFKDLVLQYFNSYNNINFFLERIHAYEPQGRLQTEEESDQLGVLIEQELQEFNIPYTKLQSENSLNRMLEILGILDE